MKNLARRIYNRLKPSPGQPGPVQYNKLDYLTTYRGIVDSLEHVFPHDEAMKRAVGGQFEAMGLLELEALRHFGLREHDYLIDVGCGSGRLAKPLSGYLTGRYLGIDVVPSLLQYAREIVGRPDWRFETATGLTIPEADEAADMVCFFSVLTHLMHEQSFLYLREATRVLKPGGGIVFSFLDFTMPHHWPVFEDTLQDVGVNAQHLNVFLSKDAITVWAERLGLQLEATHDGSDAFIPLSQPIAFEDGHSEQTRGALGQSVCLLRKPLRSGSLADR